MGKAPEQFPVSTAMRTVFRTAKHVRVTVVWKAAVKVACCVMGREAFRACNATFVMEKDIIYHLARNTLVRTATVLGTNTESVFFAVEMEGLQLSSVVKTAMVPVC